MKYAALLLTLSMLVPAVARAGDAPQAPPAPWPQANGPFGNFTAPRYGVALVDDMTQARHVWTSEENELGYGKTSSSGFLSNRARWPGYPGSSNSLIAAEGMIFAFSFRPAGEAWHAAGRQPEAFERFTPEEQARIRRALSIDADDVTVAIDMETGRTVWKAVEEGRGLFRGMGKRGGWNVSPAYSDGRVFSLGTTGRLYAYDAQTGAKVWETTIGAAHERWEREKQDSLERRRGPESSGYVSLVVADGVLIVPLFDGNDFGLRGVNTRTGETMWEVPNATARTATPAVWRHGDREYVLSATHGFADLRNGTLQLIDPKDGTVLWKVEGGWATPIVRWRRRTVTCL